MTINNLEQIALGCANSAAMRAIDAGRLAALSGQQLEALIVDNLDGHWLASDQQLAGWYQTEIAGAGLGDLGELAGWWKKLRHAISSVTKKIVKVAVAPIKAVFNPNWKKIKKYAPQAVMFAAGAFTGNPALMAQSVAGALAAKQARAQQAGAQAEYDAQVQAQAQAQADAQAAYDAQMQAQTYSQSYQSPGWKDTSALQTVRTADGRIIRLPQPIEQPRVVGLNAQGIMDSIKTNPLPWVAGGGLLLLALRR